MSIRTNPIKAVPSLLKRLRAIEEYENMNNLNSVLNNIKDLFSKVKKNEEELLDTLTLVDGYLRNFNTHKLIEEKEKICERIRNSMQKLLPFDATQSIKEDAESSSKTIHDMEADKNGRVKEAPYFTQLEEFEEFQVHHILGIYPKHCLLSLLHFPKNVVMKKRHIIYWWIGLGSMENTWPQTEKEGEDMFNYLFYRKLILPHGSDKSSVVNKFKINHWIHHEQVRPLLQNEEQFCGIYSFQYDTSHGCLALDEQRVKLSDEFDFEFDHWRAIFNVNASYLSFGVQWMAKMKNLGVLHLGRWQDSVSHHIEVESEEFLEELRDQKNLKYLSLCGISRISKLPLSILELESLEILDLKACHNLETLPNDISAMKMLKHLDVSECYLLESMPKGIEKLIELQVLKGFVIGNSRKTSCRISDVAKLKKLKKLSIYIGSKAVIQDKEFESLKHLLALKHLKISWAVSDPRYGEIQMNFPSGLEKLHLEGFPGEKIPEWLKPSKLPKEFKKEYTISGWLLKPIKHSRGLKELNITGGKLRSLDHGEDSHWYVEIMHLKYLKHLKVELTKLQELFPFLRYVEIKQIQNYVYFEEVFEERKK
ncbi:hypothetical protein VNO77_39401 [Canavalia gladiata]|uniref:Disease resistance R13L4/SHOC-2-like LRR domain-containing protein n=1 Tax=Canavalia gladiata TaxID=3824 RepID=A0AAN9KDC5_CANGL